MYIIKDNKKLELKYAKSFFKRLIGFMFKKNINYALCFPKCNSIHTIFMRNKIDVIMTNKDNKILYIFKDFKKYKIILPKKNVYYTYELPINTLNFEINEQIKIAD